MVLSDLMLLGWVTLFLWATWRRSHIKRHEHQERLRAVEERTNWLETELAILKEKYAADELSAADLDFLTGRVLMGETASNADERVHHHDPDH
jgi:hypothetical protein